MECMSPRTVCRCIGVHIHCVYIKISNKLFAKGDYIANYAYGLITLRLWFCFLSEGGSTLSSIPGHLHL